MTRSGVLIFVEDPGAANYIAELPPVLQAQGYPVRLLADGSAVSYLQQRQVAVEPVSPTLSVAQLLQDWQPGLVLVGTSENPQTLGLALIQQAQRLEIVTVAVIDALANAAYRFRGDTEDPLAYASDWLVVPDDWTRVAYEQLGYPADRIQVCGHPHYDYVRAIATQLSQRDPQSLRRTVLPDAAGDRPIITFVAEISTGLNPEQFQYSPDYTLMGWGQRTRRTHIVLEEVLDACQLLNPRPYLVLRLHPKNSLEEFTPYLDQIDQVSQGGSPLDVIYLSDLVVGMTSMLLLEAVLLNKPTLAVIPKATELEWLPGGPSQLIPAVTTREQLQRVFQDWYRYGWNWSDRSRFNAIATNSLQRLIHVLQQLLP